MAVTLVRFVIVILLAVLSPSVRTAAAQPASADSGAAPARLHLLVIGVDEYGGGQNLTGAVNDARAIARALEARFPTTTNLHLLLDRDATRQGVDRAMQSIIAAAAPQDIFAFFFAGHGADDAAEPRLILADSAPRPRGARAGERRVIVPRLLRSWLNVMPARQQFVVVDAVNGGAFFQALQSLDLAQRAEESESANPNLAVITVAGLAMEIPRPDGTMAGALTYALTETLADSTLRSASAILGAVTKAYDALRPKPVASKPGPQPVRPEALLLHLGGADFALAATPAVSASGDDKSVRAEAEARELAEARQLAEARARAEQERARMEEWQRREREMTQARQSDGRPQPMSSPQPTPSTPTPTPSPPPPPPPAPPPPATKVALQRVSLTVGVSAELVNLPGGATVSVNGQPAEVAGNQVRVTLPLDSVGTELRVRVAQATGATDEFTIPMSGTRGLGIGGPAARVQAAAAPERRSIALLFATNEYDHEKDLRNPVFDAEAIGKELAERYGFDVRLVLNATRRQVMDTLDHYSARAGAEHDQLLVFFAGHGSYDQRHTQDGYIVARDTRPAAEDQYKDTAVQYNWIRRRLANATSRHVLLMLDVCYGGSFIERVSESSTRSGDDDPMYRSVDLATHLERTRERTTRRYLTAGGIERVPDGRPGEHSPFARRFLEALRTYGGTRGFLTLADLHAAIQAVDPEPRAGGFERDEPGSDFVFVPRR